MRHTIEEKVKEVKMDYTTAEYVPIFKALADETRLKIIDMLSCGTMCACDILEEFSISQSTLSYHMRILTESGLVSANRDGSWMRYTLNRQKADELLEFLKIITNDKEDCICKTRLSGKNTCCPS